MSILRSLQSRLGHAKRLQVASCKSLRRSHRVRLGLSLAADPTGVLQSAPRGRLSRRERGRSGGRDFRDVSSRHGSSPRTRARAPQTYTFEGLAMLLESYSPGSASVKPWTDFWLTLAPVFWSTSVKIWTALRRTDAPLLRGAVNCCTIWCCTARCWAGGSHGRARQCISSQVYCDTRAPVGSAANT